jgi:SAM-dependent methyltransferase
MPVSERHRYLAEALPVGAEGPVVDLGCGDGVTLLALRERLGPEVELVGAEREPPTLVKRLATDENARAVAADLREPLPFSDASVEAALCHNTLECLPDKQAFLREVARVLRPGGHLLLAHTDFDTMVFNASDIDLTRRLVHANADTQEKWMDASDGTIGRKLVAIGQHSPLELTDTFAWVVLDTGFAEDGAAQQAVRSIAAAVRRDHHDELAARLDEWVDDLRTLARRGESLFSVNDYAVLLRNPRT